MREAGGGRALVTGAGGFLGRPLCRRLAAEGWEVIGVSRRPRPPGLPVSGWECRDLGAPGEAAACLAEVRPSVVFHLAARVTGSRALEEVLPVFRANLAATVELLAAAAARSEPVRVVLAGSMEEPEAGEVPASPYAAAKGAADAYAGMFRALYELPVVRARLFMVYGPGQDDRTKLVPATALAFLRGEPPRLASGRRPVDWIYVDDAVAGLAALAAAPGIEGERIDLGSGRLVTIREVVEKLRAIAGARVEPQFGALPDRPGDRPGERPRIADVEATRRRLGWAPAVDLDEGLRRTVDFYREELEAERALPGC